MRLTVAGIDAVEGELHLPRSGVWHLDARLDGEAAPTGRVTLDLDGHSFVGTAIHAGVADGAPLVRVVGGAGGLSTLVAPKAWGAAALRLVLADLLGEVGESLSPQVAATVTERQLQGWVRKGGVTAGTAVGALAEAVGLTWRVLPDGTVWLGEESWAPESEADVDVVEDHPVYRRLLLAGSTSHLLPGTTFQGQRVGHVTHSLARQRTTLLLETATDTDRVKGGLVRLATQLLSKVDHRALYPGRVVVANADGTVDVQLDDATLPGLASVPLRAGAAGLTYRAAENARVLVGFAGGSPQAPVAMLWEGERAAQSMVLAVEDTLDLGAEDPGEYAAVASLVVSELSALRSTVNALVTAFNAHVHVTTCPAGAGATAATAAPASPPAAVGDVASSVVRLAP